MCSAGIVKKLVILNPDMHFHEDKSDAENSTTEKFFAAIPRQKTIQLPLTL